MKDKEEIFLKNRLLELSDKAAMRNVATHSVFLNLYEQTVLGLIQNSFSNVNMKIFGGYEDAERRLVCFVPRNETDFDFSFISYLRVEPIQPKFSDKLSHRDFLGAVMNLGIERFMIGDICVDENNAHIVVLSQVEETIISELNYIKHTKVKVIKESKDEISFVQRSKIKSINLASQRLDVAISAVFNLSRKLSSGYFEAEKVFVNNKMTTNHSYIIKSNDLISVRGLGRFRYIGNEHTTRKGRLLSEAEIYL